MTKIKRIHFFPAVLITGILAGACTFPVTSSDDFTIRFASGLSNGSIIPLGETVQLTASGTSTAGTARRGLFFADGEVIGETNLNLTGGAESFDFRIDWTPAESGEVVLQAAILRPSGYGYSETVTVCVLPFERGPGLHHEIALVHYEGDCRIPSRSFFAEEGDISLFASASPDSIDYVPLGESYESCPDTQSLITFEARADDPPDEVVLVTVTFEVSPAFHSYINSEYTLILNHTDDEVPDRKIFSMSYDTYIHLARSLEESSGVNIPGEITWTARAFGRNGATLAQAGPYTIPANPVHCDGTSVLTSTTAPILIGPTPASTPASALDCPPGTYFAPATNRCIAIQIVPADGGEGGDDDGASGPSGCQPPPGGCGSLNWYPEPYCICFE